MDNSRAPLIAAIGVVLICVLLVFVLIIPKIGQVSSAQDDLTAARTKQQTLETQEAALQDLKTKAPENRAVIAQVDKQIPPNADEPGLILLLHNAAVASGLEISKMSPTPPALDATINLSVIVVSITASGTYNEMTQFAHAIETLPRAAQITSLALSPTDQVDASGHPQLTATIQLNAYTSESSTGTASPAPTPSGGGG